MNLIAVFIAIGLAGAALLFWYPVFALYLIAFWNPFQYYLTKNTGLLPSWSIWLEDLSVYLLFLVTLVVIIRKNGRVRTTSVDPWILMFLAIATVSTIYNYVNPIYVAAGLRSQLQYVLLFLVIVNLDFSETTLKRFFLISLSIALLQAPVSVAQFLQEGVGRYNPDAVFGTFAWGYANIVGYYLLIFVLVLAGLGMTAKHYSRLYFLSALVLLVPIILTSSRATIFFFLIGMVLLLGKRLFSKRVLITFPILVIALAIFVMIYYGNRLGDAQTELDPRKLVAEQLDNVNSPGRLRYLEITYNLMKNDAATLLVGFGPGTYASTAGTGLRAPLLVKVTENNYSPNIQSQAVAVLGEYGLLGTAVLVCMYITVLLMMFRASVKLTDPFWKGIAVGMRAVSVVFILGIFTERLWEIQPIPYYYWFFAAAVYLASRRQKGLGLGK